MSLNIAINGMVVFYFMVVEQITTVMFYYRKTLNYTLVHTFFSLYYIRTILNLLGNMYHGTCRVLYLKLHINMIFDNRVLNQAMLI